MLIKDSIDYQIALALIRNCRIRIIDLAKTIGVSPPTVTSKMKAMEQEGIIEKYTTLIDPYALGYHLLSIIDIRVDPSKVEAVIQSLYELDEIVLVTVIAGNYSIEVFSKHTNQDTFYTFIMKNICGIDGIQEFSPRIILKEHWKTNILNGQPILLAENPPILIGKADQTILELLRDNARITNSFIAKKVKLSPETIAKRISKMENSGVIRGYRVTINPAEIGYPIQARIKAKVESSRVNETIKKILTFNEVFIVNQVTGPYDIHFSVLAPDIRSLHNFIQNNIALILGVEDTLTNLILRRYAKFPGW